MTSTPTRRGALAALSALAALPLAGCGSPPDPLSIELALDEETVAEIRGKAWPAANAQAALILSEAFAAKGRGGEEEDKAAIIMLAHSVANWVGSAGEPPAFMPTTGMDTRLSSSSSGRRLSVMLKVEGAEYSLTATY